MTDREKNSRLPSALMHMKTVREVHEYYQKIIRCMPNNIYWLDRNCITQGCNDNVLKFVGIKNIAEFVGIDYQEMAQIAGWSEGHGEFYKQEDLKVMSSGVPILDVEDPPLHDENGEAIYYLTSRVPVFDDKEQEVIGVVGISVNITQRKKLEEELRQAKERAAEAGERAKTEFIANISHDIRMPMTGIIGISEFMKETMEKKEDREKAEIIYQGANQLLGLLNEVLETLSIDTVDENQVQHKSFDLYAAIDDLYNLEKPAILSHHLDFHLSMDDRIPQFLVGDKTKIHRILLNLMGNGIKFTEIGSITLALKLLEIKDGKATVKFSVTDTGIGIPLEAQPQVFDRFYKVSASYKGKHKGNGIGLHIVQKYTQAMGGEISLESEVGKGTTFSLILSLPIAEASDSKEDKDYNNLIEEEKKWISTSLNAPVTAIKNQPNVSDKGLQILLIEDNILALKTLRVLFSSYEVEIEEAMDAEIAFELIKKKRFDLIVTDIGLPGISGDELVSLVRDFELHESIARQKIVALTGHADTGEFIEQCRKAGIDKVYKKPLRMIELKELIAPLLTQTAIEDPQKLSAPQAKVGGKLGVDLPDTEGELFEIECHPLLSIAKGVEALGSEEIVKEILKDLNGSSIEPEMEGLALAHKSGDWEKIRSLAHKMKGGSTYGTERLYYAFMYMERYIKAGHTQCLKALYQQMLRTIKTTTEYLDNNL